MEKRCLIDDLSATESWGILTHANKLIENGVRFSFPGNLLIESRYPSVPIRNDIVAGGLLSAILGGCKGAAARHYIFCFIAHQKVAEIVQ